jgi:carbohydrate-selective porin OprB
MAFMNFPNLLGQGNLLGVFVGQPPKIVSSDLPFARNIPELETGDNDGRPGTTTHAELFFRYRLTDHISITPGVIAVFNPRHNPDNDTVVIGAVRTTFSF